MKIRPHINWIFNYIILKIFEIYLNSCLLCTRRQFISSQGCRQLSFLSGVRQSGASDWVLDHLVGEEVREECDGCVVLRDGFLSGLGSRCVLVDFLLNNALLKLLCLLLLSLGLGVLFHLVKHTRHLARTLIHVDSILLLCLLIGEHLQAIASAVSFLSLLILYHHVFILFSEHFTRCQVNSNLPLGLLFFFDLGLCLQLLQSLLIFFLSNSLHFDQLILLLLKSFLSSLTIGNDLRECVNILDRGIFGIHLLYALIGPGSDLLTLRISLLDHSIRLLVLAVLIVVGLFRFLILMLMMVLLLMLLSVVRVRVRMRVHAILLQLQLRKLVGRHRLQSCRHVLVICEQQGQDEHAQCFTLIH